MNPRWARNMLSLPSYYTCDDVHYAWRRKMKIYHPDTKYGNTKNAVELNKAKTILLQECHFLDSDTKDNKHKTFYPFESITEELRFWNSIINGDIDDFFK